MARSFDIAEIMPSDGVLPENVRTKINKNFSRLVRMLNIEYPASSPQDDKTAAYVQEFWDSKSPALLAEANAHSDAKDAETLASSKRYTDSEISDVVDDYTFVGASGRTTTDVKSIGSSIDSQDRLPCSVVSSGDGSVANLPDAVASAPFVAVRRTSQAGGLVMLELDEVSPEPGRRWVDVYDPSSSSWNGWVER